MNLVGTTVNQRYRLRAVLGSGGMATVYRAEDSLLSRTVALKLLAPNLATKANILRRFLSEAHVMLRLHHPNVARVLDYGEAPQPFIALELVSGGSVQDLMHEIEPPSTAQVFEIIDGVLAGLINIHSSGIIHRDIKPANILLTDTGTAKLTDFGIARDADKENFQTRTGAVMGTPAFMAPEQRKSATLVTAASDLYAVGATLYALLTRRPTMDLYVREHQDEAFRELAPAFQDFLALACAFNSSDRFSNASEMQAALRSIREAGSGNKQHQMRDPSQQERAGNLPAPSGGFVGRVDELAQVQAWSDSITNRAITLVGLGGIGKSRLALEFCQRHKREYPGGVWITDLSACPSASALYHALGASLELSFKSTDQLAEIAAYLKTRERSLLVFDNAEDAHAEIQNTISDLLERVPDLKIIVTSREKFGTPWEATLTLGELDLQASTALMMYAARHTFDLDITTTDDTNALKSIARLLEGHPLSLELASAQLEILGPGQLHARLLRALKPNDASDAPTLIGVLEQTRETNDSSSSSVQASLAWSWSTLSEAEQSALAQCSVFADGFDVEAAEAIIKLDGYTDTPPLMVLLQALRAKNLLRIRTPIPGCRRLSVPRMVGYFALAHSNHAELDPTRARMARHYALMGSEDRIHLHQTSGEQAQRMAMLELSNMRRAYDWAIHDQKPDLAASLCLALVALLSPTGALQDLGTMLRQVDAQLDSNPTLRARITFERGRIAQQREGFDVAYELLESARALADANGLTSVASAARVKIAYIYGYTERLSEAMPIVEEAIRIAEQAGDERVLPDALCCRGYLTHKSGEAREALSDLQSALRGYQRLGDRLREGNCYGDLGEYNHNIGEPHRAKRYYDDALAIALERGDRAALIRCQRRIAWLHMDAADWGQAKDALLKGLAIAQEVGDRSGEASLVGTLGTIAALTKKYDEAVDHFREAEHIYQEHGSTEHAFKCKLNIGVALEKSGRFDEALEVVDQLKRVDNMIPLTRCFIDILEMSLLTHRRSWDKAQAIGHHIMPVLDKMQAWDQTIAVHAYLAICAAATGHAPEPHLAQAEAMLKRLNLAETSMMGTLLADARARAADLQREHKGHS